MYSTDSTTIFKGLFSFFAVPILLGDVTLDFMSTIAVDVMVTASATGSGSGVTIMNTNTNMNPTTTTPPDHMASLAPVYVITQIF